MHVVVDNTSFEVSDEEAKSCTIFQFCSRNGIYLPCFCFHDSLTIAGNCRICLVESNSALVASCAMPMMDNMRIFTNSPRVSKARESVMEFLLANHPLDCPICDQGGECDLQDISLTFGSDSGRFYEKRKRSVDNLNCCGPLIKTIMTRCIHCTRCVSFISEISGVFDFGVLGRGNSMEIGTYLEFFSLDMLSGNVIDICPVGALTSMPFAFTARSWELLGFEGVDVLDSLASSVRMDVANNKVMRVVPLLNEDINEEWMTNKARFSYDSLFTQRLNYPKLSTGSTFLIISWGSAFNLFVTFLKSCFVDSIKVICGYFSDLRTVFSAKRFFSSLGCSNFYYINDCDFFVDFSFLFLLNNTMVALESLVLGLFLGVSLRLELPLLVSSLRKSFLNFGAKFYSFGLAVDYLTFPVLNLGNSVKTFFSLASGCFFKLSDFVMSDFLVCSLLNYICTFFSKPVVFVGESLLSRFDSLSFLSLVSYFVNSIALNVVNAWSVFSMVPLYLGRISCSELGFVPGPFYFEQSSEDNFVSLYYLCGVDDYKIFSLSNFIVYQGSLRTLSSLFSNSNLMFPVSIHVESSSVFMNLEGRIRPMNKMLTPFKFVFDDFEVFRALFLVFYREMKSNFSYWMYFYSSVFYFKTLVSYDLSVLLDFTGLTSKLINLIGFDFNSYVFDINFVSVNFLSLFLSLPYCWLLFNTVINKLVMNGYSADFFLRNSKVMAVSAAKSTLGSFSQLVGI